MAVVWVMRGERSREKRRSRRDDERVANIDGAIIMIITPNIHIVRKIKSFLRAYADLIFKVTSIT